MVGSQLHIAEVGVDDQRPDLSILSDQGIHKWSQTELFWPLSLYVYIYDLWAKERL